MSAALPWPRIERSVLARITPFALYMLCLILRSELAGHVEAGFLQWLYPLQIGLAAIALWHFRDAYHELHGAGLGLLASIHGLPLAIMLGLAVFVAWINLDIPVLSIAPSQGVPPPSLDGVADWRWIVLRIMGAAVVVPLMEELFWRSFVMRWLDARDFTDVSAALVSWRSVLISSLVFGLEHHLWFAGLLAGIAYAYLYRRYGLWSAIIAHALTNLALGLWVLHTEQWQFW